MAPSGDKVSTPLPLSGRSVQPKTSFQLRDSFRPSFGSGDLVGERLVPELTPDRGTLLGQPEGQIPAWKQPRAADVGVGPSSCPRHLTPGRTIHALAKEAHGARPGVRGQAAVCRRAGSIRRGRAESTPGERAEADPGLEKRRGGDAEMDLIRVGRPVASPRFSRPGLIGRDASSRLDHRSSGPSAGPSLAGQPSGCLSALWARPARSGRGADVFGPFRRALFKAPVGPTLQSRRPPESDATERPPRDRLPSASRTRSARGSLAGGECRQMTMPGNRWAMF
jgi:hypothetical protein